MGSSNTFYYDSSAYFTLIIAGDISFGNKSWAGPLFTIIGTSITFNGNGHNFNGGGPFYWDGTGLSSGTQKPDPMMKIEMSGIFQNVTVVNSPARAFAVSNPAPLLMTGLTVDDSQGDYANNRSNGITAGHNTDGFDVSGHDVTIQNCTVHNQDDCLAIGKGTNIIFDRNTCIGGHGISIGSIGSNVAVSGVIVTGNIITDSDQALRIKTIASATGSVVGNVTYSGNTAKGIRRFGVIIDQSYPSTLGTPGMGTIISVLYETAFFDWS
ncbi:glycoside hydrolase family 28 protein [Laccaria bicolor S238N-H82]|uniref:endo-polygalacturonase n=1 Tax=Laccaria bicolor (strain S238N-H82 / ATCC MYA-4686) TaxID=486041 RepID=B0D189_LACBS|nr:glycoside hydrolase family 28 protein [Laccaria bicolor S238N-H82]EDR11591.1 glycoside hydrolase family 28 protein [Laccaria bicolor S238N-H82]|eukprot:XP_001877488.1 glycoside hydrolase family 28 protein [Laccaria bicolor S238N-H82]